MRLAVCLILFAALAFALNGGHEARALPVFKKHFEDYYVKKGDNPQLTEAVAEAKCNVCHYGTDKKNHNDYGLALQKFLKKDKYTFKRVKGQPQQVQKEIEDAFKKVEEMDSTKGKKFGELLKAGELPGTAPEGEEASE